MLIVGGKKEDKKMNNKSVQSYPDIPPVDSLLSVHFGSWKKHLKLEQIKTFPLHPHPLLLLLVLITKHLI